MRAREALTRLRKADIPSWEIPGMCIKALRDEGHVISWEKTAGNEAIWTLEHDANICKRCSEISVIPQPSLICRFCEFELGLREYEKDEPEVKTHCVNGHRLIPENLSEDGRCKACRGRYNYERQIKRKLKKAEAA